MRTMNEEEKNKVNFPAEIVTDLFIFFNHQSMLTQTSLLGFVKLYHCIHVIRSFHSSM